MVLVGDDWALSHLARQVEQSGVVLGFVVEAAVPPADRLAKCLMLVVPVVLPPSVRAQLQVNWVGTIDEQPVVA